MNFTFEHLKIFFKDHSINISSDISNNQVFIGIGSLLNSTNQQITFFNNLKYVEDLLQTKALGCFITKNHVNLLPDNCKPIIVKDPYKSFALSTNFFFKTIKTESFIHQSSAIDPSAKIESNVDIGKNVVINKNVKIGKGSILYDNVYIGENVIIGENNVFYPNVVITNSIINNNCLIQSGAVIGDSGFGFTIYENIPIIHIGNVVIGNNVNIGSNTTIDRASLDSTFIGNNVKIDNLVQIAHSVSIGDNCIIAAQVGIAGSTSIGKNCIIGGQAGVSGHIYIGNNVTIAAKSGVTKNIQDNKIIAGFPAIDIKQWKKNIINEKNKKYDY